VDASGDPDRDQRLSAKVFHARPAARNSAAPARTRDVWSGLPLLTYERLISDWRGLGYSDEVLEKVFSGNAERFLSQVRNGGGMSK
jgi:hypothetical protein